MIYIHYFFFKFIYTLFWWILFNSMGVVDSKSGGYQTRNLDVLAKMPKFKMTAKTIKRPLRTHYHPYVSHLL